jgi:hypothetical protein
MAQRKAHHIWIEQCEAAQTVRARFGLKAAFDYIVGEKLLNCASAASTYPEFARELPQFVSEVRRMFRPDEIATQLAQIERAQAEKDVAVLATRRAVSPARAGDRRHEHPARHLRDFTGILQADDNRSSASGLRASRSPIICRTSVSSSPHQKAVPVAGRRSCRSWARILPRRWR